MPLAETCRLILESCTIVGQRGSMPVPQAVECVVQAARGLQYAHEEGYNVLYGDLHVAWYGDPDEKIMRMPWPAGEPKSEI